MPRSVVISVLKLPHGAEKYATPHHSAQKESEFGTKPSKEEGGRGRGEVLVAYALPLQRRPLPVGVFISNSNAVCIKNETRPDEDATRRPCTVAHYAAAHRGAKNDD